MLYMGMSSNITENRTKDKHDCIQKVKKIIIKKGVLNPVLLSEAFFRRPYNAECIFELVE